MIIHERCHYRLFVIIYDDFLSWKFFDDWQRFEYQIRKLNVNIWWFDKLCIHFQINSLFMRRNKFCFIHVLFFDDDRSIFSRRVDRKKCFEFRFHQYIYHFFYWVHEILHFHCAIVQEYVIVYYFQLIRFFLLWRKFDSRILITIHAYYHARFFHLWKNLIRELSFFRSVFKYSFLDRFRIWLQHNKMLH